MVEVERTRSFLLDRTALGIGSVQWGQTVSPVVTVEEECLLQAPGGRTITWMEPHLRLCRDLVHQMSLGELVLA